MMEEQRTPASAVYQELTRRAAHRPPYGRNHYAEYLLLLDVCQEILAQAPDSIEALDATEIGERLAENLTDLAEAIQMILPGGIIEFQSYLSEATYRRRLRYNAGTRPPRQLYRNV